MNKINFKISELIHSEIAERCKISNMPDIKSLDNILNLIVYCLQPIRDVIAKPMIISSGYRSKALNKKVGGSVNSQHLSGQAVDFTVKNLKPDEIINIIKKNNIEFDQLINEYDKWVHVSFNMGKNRKQILSIK